MEPKDDEVAKLHINQLTLTALDLTNEAHDTHHPAGLMLYYEDQKEESLRKAESFRESRMPKFFGFFERMLKGNKEGNGMYIVGGKLTYADTTLWQTVNGQVSTFVLPGVLPSDNESRTKHALPKEISATRNNCTLLFDTFYPTMKEEKGIKEYLSSARRLPYSMGLFRHYPELDRR